MTVAGKMNLLSLFAGAGGLDIGFESTGMFETLAAIEFQPEYSATLKKNMKRGFLPTAEIIQEDIRKLDPKKIARRYFPKGRVDGIIGGPPCEAFSVRGKKGGLSDPRGLLVFDFIRWAVELRPAFVLMENVPPLAKFDNGKILYDLQKELDDAGYSTCSAVLNAAGYGAATKRQRLILLAFLGTQVKMPEPTHTEGTDLPGLGLLPALTVRAALRGLPKPGYDETVFPTWHRLVNHTPEVVQRFSSLLLGQQDNIRKRTRLHPDRPSLTIVAGNHQGTRTHIHPFEPRELTNRECARLHGFPDEFEFCGTGPAVCKQIANSVPIPFARTLAESIFRQLSGTDEISKKPLTA